MSKKERKLGRLKGKIQMAADFDAPFGGLDANTAHADALVERLMPSEFGEHEDAIAAARKDVPAKRRATGAPGAS